MSTLKLSIEAQLPLVKVSTTDTLNFCDVVNALVGIIPIQYDLGKLPKPKSGELYYIMGEDPSKMPIEKLYTKFVESECTVLFVNPKKSHDLIHDAGVIPVPKAFIKANLQGLLDEDELDSIISSFGGLTLHQIGEVVRLTQARDGCLTPQGVNLTRKLTVSTSQGLNLVDTTMDMYDTDPGLEAYTIKNKKYFLDTEMDHRLVPRGILFDGTPGTGKSQGAKYIANQWGVPLFRLDGTVQSKFVGESENNMANALSQLDNEAPCVLLVDEVEKFFNKNNNDSSGVTQRLMGTLLWWLQEHRSRVFTVLTCNNKGIIPPELYREGRIDAVHTFQGLVKDKGRDFAAKIFKTFVPEPTVDDIANLYKYVDGLYGNVGDRVSHAALTQSVYKYLKG